MADAPEPVLVVLEQVRVDRTEPEAVLLGERPQLAPVVRPVPGDVNGDARTRAGQPVDESGVGDLLVDGARGSGPGEDVEPGARVGVPPRRRLDRERPELGQGALDVDPAFAQKLQGGLAGHRAQCDRYGDGMHVWAFNSHLRSQAVRFRSVNLRKVLLTQAPSPS
jgi:hypothetical protein